MSTILAESPHFDCRELINVTVAPVLATVVVLVLLVDIEPTADSVNESSVNPPLDDDFKAVE